MNGGKRHMMNSFQVFKNVSVSLRAEINRNAQKSNPEKKPRDF